jgi:molybdenum cofactor biosynthesis enzyme MoaA
MSWKHEENMTTLMTLDEADNFFALTYRVKQDEIDRVFDEYFQRYNINAKTHDQTSYISLSCQTKEVIKPYVLAYFANHYLKVGILSQL